MENFNTLATSPEHQNPQENFPEAKNSSPDRPGLMSRQGPNHEMLDQALSGLLSSLEKRSGKLYRVTGQDIISSCEINPDAFHYYYRNADGVMEDVYKIIGDIISGVAKESPNFSGNSEEKVRWALMVLFERLRKQPTALKILFQSDDLSFW